MLQQKRIVEAKAGILQHLSDTRYRAFRAACKEATWVFVLSRLIILLTNAASIFLLPQFIPLLRQNLALVAYSNDPYKLKAFLFSWLHWDTLHYVTISVEGYKSTQNVGFFPLWPLLQHFAGLLLGGSFPGSYYIAGLLLSNLFYYLALILLYYLLAEDFDSMVARRTLLYLTFAPFALFFFAGYTESLFLLLCVSIFLLVRRGKPLDWWLAGFLGFLAALTRSSGIVLVIPFLIMYIQQFWQHSWTPRSWSSWAQKLNTLAPIMLIPAGILIYMLYLYFTKGNPFIISKEEELNWHRHFSFPWETATLAIRTLITPPLLIHLRDNLFFFGFVLITLCVLVLGWKHLPLHYSLFALGLATFTLSFPAYTGMPLYSQPRYLMVIFPISAILAIWGNQRRFHYGFLALSLGLFVLDTFYFVGNFWIV